MRKDKIIIEDIDTFDDYKMEYVWERTKLDMESRDGWLYLGADASNPGFAKVGLTMGIYHLDPTAQEIRIITCSVHLNAGMTYH